MPYYLKKGLPDHLSYLQRAYHFSFLLFISTRYLLPNTSSKSFSVFFYLMSTILVSKRNSIKLCCQNNNNNKKPNGDPLYSFSHKNVLLLKDIFLSLDQSLPRINHPFLSWFPIKHFHPVLPLVLMSKASWKVHKVLSWEHPDNNALKRCPDCFDS